MKHTGPKASAPTEPRRSGAYFYALTWRWHFYCGLFVVPFLTVLAATGLVMILYSGLLTRFGAPVHLEAQGQVQPLAAQVAAVQERMPGATLMAYISPSSAQRPGWFIVGHHEQTHAIAVDPYSAQVVKTVDAGQTIYFWAQRIHSNLLLGRKGLRLMEIAAGLGIVMVVTGLYLHWPRKQSWRAALTPNLAVSGRRWWKSLHASIGLGISLVLLAFLLTGMAWTDIWGGRLVQPMGSYPAQRLDHVPVSDLTHATLNTGGMRDVPWGLEQTPLPRSGSLSGTPGLAEASVSLDGVDRLARQLGFSGQYQIKLPQGPNGVYTIMADTMAGDIANPMDERTVHVDRYTGNVLANIGFSDYSLAAKTMSTGVALHQGNMGWFSLLLNVVLCLAVLFLGISGVAMWWIRRPRGSSRLGAPPQPAPAPLWKSGAIVMLLMGLLFPLAGATLLAALLFDWLVLSRFKALKTRLS